MTIKHSFLNFFFGGGGVKMYGKMAISAYILKIVENDPFLKLQMRAKEMFNPYDDALYNYTKCQKVSSAYCKPFYDSQAKTCRGHIVPSPQPE